MDHIIHSMLEMAQLEDDELTLELGDCDLAVLTRNALDMIEASAEQRGIRLETEIDTPEAIVFGDSRLLEQVVNNLLSNAVKYNRDNGIVWVTLQVLPAIVRLDVRDSGHGIPEADQPHVFERFYRARSPGTIQATGSGLGLTIVKSIVDLHAGHLWFESVEGEGSLFSFTLPRRKQQSEGTDSIRDVGGQNGEGNDVSKPSLYEPSIEDDDDVDDNEQEAAPRSDSDSTSDEV
jgi:two-component system sensor histidine kinase ResE